MLNLGVLKKRKESLFAKEERRKARPFAEDDTKSRARYVEDAPAHLDPAARILSRGLDPPFPPRAVVLRRGL